MDERLSRRTAGMGSMKQISFKDGSVSLQAPPSRAQSHAGSFAGSDGEVRASVAFELYMIPAQ